MKNEKSQAMRFEALLPVMLEELQNGNPVTFTAYGNSMHPTIRNGTDRVTIVPTRTAPKKDDIVFYRRDNGSFVLHRIVRQSRDGAYTLCGDHQYVLEKGIRRDQIIAILSHYEKNGRIFYPGTAGDRIFCLILPLRRTSLHIFRSLRARIIKK